MTYSFHDGRTCGIYDDVSRCEDIDDVYELLHQNEALMIDWQTFICGLLEGSGQSYKGFAAKCGMSRNTIASWCERGQLPRSREQFLRVAFAAGMDLDETNSFLRRYGKYPQLYPKNAEDAIWIFALRNKMTWQQAGELRAEFEQYFTQQTELARGSDFLDTRIVEEELLQAQTTNQLKRFIADHAEAFSDTYHKLLDFIDSQVAVASMEGGKPRTLNAYLEERLESKTLAATFNGMISNLRRHGVVPSRTKLIALGILLEMPPEQLNKMLELAGMERLCARDRLESLIIFATESTIVMNPGIELSNAILLRNFTENPDIRRGCDEIIERMQLCEYAEDDTEIYDFVVTSLKTMDDDSVSEIKHLLEIDGREMKSNE